MGIGGFLQGLGQQYGRNVEWQKQNSMDEANIALKQQAVQEGQMKMQAFHAQAQMREKVGAQINAEMKADASTISDPMKQSELWRKAEGEFNSTGDFKAADNAGKQADQLLNQAKQARLDVAKKQQDAKEILSTTALNYSANPTSNGAAEVARAAVGAGINAADIPAPGTPEFKSWVKQQTTAAMTGKERVQAAEKAKEYQQTKNYQMAVHNDNADALYVQREQMAQFREAELRIMKGRSDIPPMSQDSLEAMGAEVASGRPISQAVPGYGKSAVQVRTLVNAEAIRQIMAEDPTMTAAKAGSLLSQRSLDYRAAGAGATSGARTAGTTATNIEIASGEADKMIDVSRNLLNNRNMTNFPSLNALKNYVAKGTGDPEIVKLNTSLNSLINSYARAINPKGVATVRDKDHAENLINAALSNGQLSGAFEIMQTEMRAAHSSAVEALHAHTSLSGQRSSTPPASGAIPSGWSVKEH